AAILGILYVDFMKASLKGCASGGKKRFAGRQNPLDESARYENPQRPPVSRGQGNGLLRRLLQLGAQFLCGAKCIALIEGGSGRNDEGEFIRLGFPRRRF